MEHKEAAEILINLLGKDLLDETEKQALQIAIGTLSWTSLAQSRIKGMGKKRKEKSEQN